MVSPALLRDFDAVAASLGHTPKLDKYGTPVPLGQPEVGGYVYVVWIGRCVGLFYNWGLTQAMTCGFSGSAFRKYHTLEDARQGWAQGPTGVSGVWCVPESRSPIPTPGLQQHRSSSPTADDALPPEVELSKTSPASISLRLPSEQPDSDQEYWADDDLDYTVLEDIEQLEPAGIPPTSINHRFHETPVPPASPFIPAITSFPDMALLTGGTMSPGAVNTPVSELEEFQALIATSSPSSRGTAGDAPSAVAHERRRAVHFDPDVERSSGVSYATPRDHAHIADIKTEGTSSGLRSPAHNHLSARGAQTSNVDARTHRTVYVVIRGDDPGLYFNKHIALERLGVSPGMKVVRFDSLSQGAWYFVKEYMAGQVGHPVLSDYEPQPGDEVFEM